MANSDECLFLLEVLVDKLIFVRPPSFSDQQFKTCISLEFLELPALEICDDNPVAPETEGGSYVKQFNSGKSCLFALKKSDIARAEKSFLVKLTVYKSLPCGCLPSKIILGECSINLTKAFSEARYKFEKDGDSVSFESLKDTFKLKGTDGSESGSISLFLRVSCFGSLLVTKFKGPVEDSVSYTNEESAADPTAHTYPEPYKYQNISQKQSHFGPEQLTVNPACQEEVDPYQRTPCLQKEEPCYCKGPGFPAKEKDKTKNLENYCLHVPKSKQKQFEEIGAVVTGNELRLKVPAEFAPLKKISETHTRLQKAYQKSGTIGCGPCFTPCTENQVCLQMPRAPECCLGERPQQMQFRCVTEGCKEVFSHRPTLAQVPISVPTPFAAEKTLHPNKDVFVFKVFKTAVTGQRKTKLELELVAPKGPDKRPPPRIDTRETQVDCPPPCSPCCAPPACCAAICRSVKRHRPKRF